jgi:hypothetical protein
MNIGERRDGKPNALSPATVHGRSAAAHSLIALMTTRWRRRQSPSAENTCCELLLYLQT